MAGIPLPNLNTMLRMKNETVPEDFLVETWTGYMTVGLIAFLVGLSLNVVKGEALEFGKRFARVFLSPALSLSDINQGENPTVPDRRSTWKKAVDTKLALYAFMFVVVLTYLGDSIPKFGEAQRIGEGFGAVIGVIVYRVWSGSFQTLPEPVRAQQKEEDFARNYP